MAKFQIPLNGSNIVSNDRKKAFQDALNDQHKVECADQDPVSFTEQEPPTSLQVSEGKHRSHTSQKQTATSAAGLEDNPSEFGQALDHTYTHQARTMEIHQQYLAQQAENIQLITTVLNQQGKVLDQINGSTQAQIIETFQRTLDNFHLIREQGLAVHQEFLARQAEFSERYLSFLENSGDTIKTIPVQKKQVDQKPTEWVVHVPPIVLDEKEAPVQKPSKDTVSAPAIEAGIQSASTASSSVSTDALSQSLLNIVAEKTGYPAEMLELDMDLEADLGIDSIKRVEILGALEEEYPSLPSADTEVLAQTRTLQEIIDYMDSESSDPIPTTVQEPRTTDQAIELSSPPADEDPQSSESREDVNESNHSIAELTSILLEIVAEKTGYPVEMLEADMDMEADLGIDSIKRVEILGVMEEKVPGLPSVDAESLAELRTLGQIADLMGNSRPADLEQEPVVQELKKKANPGSLKTTPVKLAALPDPDHLDFSIPAESPLIITNDGSDFTAQVVLDLTQNGWKVALWDFPTSLVSSKKQKLPKGVNRIIQAGSGKESIDEALESLRNDHGTASGFIHLHPNLNGEDLFSENESELIKQVFLIAGSLKSDLTKIVPDSRNLFMAVTRTDGKLGFSNQKSFQEGSGLTGLVKSLNWEWPEVFCRLVDIDRELSVDASSKMIIQEIHDPNQGLLEVGLAETGRTTPVREDQ